MLGIVKELPDWATAKLAAYNKSREPEKPATPEKVARYTITERTQVGNKQFVLGENPAAPSPFATWQHIDGRSGYDYGHYFQNRESAMEDLLERAENERGNASTGKAAKRRANRDAR